MHSHHLALLQLEDRNLPDVLVDPLGLASLGIAPTGTAPAALYATVTTPAAAASAPSALLAPGVSVLAPPPALGSGVTPDALSQRHLVFHPIAAGSAANLPNAVYPSAVPVWDPIAGLYEWIGDYTNNPDGISLHSPITSVTMAGPPTGGGTFGYDYGGSYTTYQDFGPKVEPDNEVYAAVRYPGSYAVQTSFADGTTAVEWLDVKVHWGGVGPETHDAQARMALPKAFMVISNPQIDPYGFCAFVASTFPQMPRAATTADAIAALQADYKAAGNQPISATLIGHGSPNWFQFGGSDFLQDNNVNVQALGNALKGKVSHLELWGCKVGAGFDANPVHVVKSLAQDLHAPGGPAVSVTAFTKDINVVEGSLLDGTHFTGSVAGAWVTQVVG